MSENRGGSGEPEPLLDLVGLIYDAVADASRWPVFLEAFVRAVHASKATLALRDTAGDQFALVCWHGWTKQDLQLYLDRYAAIDPWRVGTSRWPEGKAGTDRDLCPREEIEASATYREFYAPQGAVHGVGGTILVTGTGQSVIIATRGPEAGPFGEAEKDTLRPLLPHLKRAALLHGKFGAMRRQVATFTGHLDRYPHGYLLTDAERRILYANAAAREIARSGDGLAITDGCVVVSAQRQDADFRQAVRQAATAGGNRLLRLVVTRPSRKKPYRLILMPVEHSGAIPLGVSVPAVSLLVIDTEAQPEPDLEVLAELFSLTPAEARVAGKLALGRDVGEIAAQSRTSVETVRTHIKRTLSKTDTSRQGELISLVLRSVPFRRG